MEIINLDQITAIVLTFIYSQLILLPLLGGLWWGIRQERQLLQSARIANRKKVVRFPFINR